VTAGRVICTCADTNHLRSNIDIIPNGSGTTVADIGSGASQIAVIDSTHFAALDRTWATNQAGTVFFYITTGNGFAYYLNRRNVCADRKASNTFYYANSNPTIAGGGVYKITFPSGVYTITRQRNTPMPVDGAHSKIRAVPYNGVTDTTGHLFWTAGVNNSDTLYYSRDGGARWTTVGTRGSVVGMNYDVGFGATKPGNDYPSVFIYGYVSGVLGVWQCDASNSAWAANAQRWTQIAQLTDLPRQCQTDLCYTVEGDGNVYGQVYLGFGGTGPVYRKH
jgi:hypothetical protein